MRTVKIVLLRDGPHLVPIRLVLLCEHLQTAQFVSL